MGKHGGSVRLDVLVEAQTGRGTPQYRCQRGLPCIERLTPQVVTVQLDEIEGVQEHASVVPPVADAVEARHAIAVAGHSLTRLGDKALTTVRTWRCATLWHRKAGW